MHLCARAGWIATCMYGCRQLCWLQKHHMCQPRDAPSLGSVWILSRGTLNRTACPGAERWSCKLCKRSARLQFPVGLVSCCTVPCCGTLCRALLCRYAYSADQLEYHYTKNKEVLKRAVALLQGQQQQRDLDSHGSAAFEEQQQAHKLVQQA